jgi:hypothetical protein
MYLRRTWRVFVRKNQDVRGDKRRHENLLTDRYQNFWAYTTSWRLLWTGEGQLGHYPFPLDADGDGFDEIAIGYALWDGNGRQLWTTTARCAITPPAS